MQSISRKIEELSELNADMDHLLASTEVATVFLDQDLRLRRYTPAVEALINVMPQDVGRPLEHLSLRIMYPELLSDVGLALQSGQLQERELEDVGGAWYLVRCLPYRSSKSHVDGVVVAFIDISATKMAQQQAEKNEERLRLIMERVNDGYWDWEFDADGNPTDNEYLSPTFKSMFGYADHEMENRASAWQDMVFPEGAEVAIANFTKHLETDGEHPFYQEVRYHHRDGSTVWVICRGVAIKGPNGTFTRMVGTHQDITQLKLAELDLQRSNDELEQFAYVASHDLQEPLRMVSSFSDMLAKRLGEQVDEKAQEYLGFITDGAERMGTLIRDLLEYSRIRSDESELESVDTASTVSDVMQSLRFAIDDAGAKVEVNDLPVVHARRGQVERVLQNLIGNGIKFAGGTSPRVRVSAEPDGAMWRFSVTDNGIGIAPENHDRVFGIFQRLHTRSDYPGNGIGLSSVKQIVQRHGGNVWLDSTPEKGTSVIFTLPGERAA